MLCLQLQTKSEDLHTLQQQFNQLKEDFLYNEGVLQDRDDEIECMEGQLKELKASHTLVCERRKDLELQNASIQSQLLIERDRCFSSAIHLCPMLSASCSNGLARIPVPSLYTQAASLPCIKNKAT